MYFINPVALLSYLCVQSEGLFNMIKEAAVGAKRLSIVIYIDGINPGNPLAPDPQRLLEAVYWTIAELPSWFIRRKDSWFTFTLLKSIIVNHLPGTMSQLAKMILRLF